jgi:predicted CopG family antitoxin
MSTKTITIMDDAYDLLKKSKLPNESFSDVIRREFSSKKKMSDFFGAWSDFDTNSLKKNIAELRYEDKKRKPARF